MRGRFAAMPSSNICLGDPELSSFPAENKKENHRLIKGRILAFIKEGTKRNQICRYIFTPKFSDK